MKKQIMEASELPYVTEGLPKYKVEGESGLTGSFYLSFVHDCSIIMLGSNGKFINAMHEDRPAPSPETPPVGWWDFKRTDCGSETYYSYHDQTGEYENYGLEGYAPGERVILNKNLEEIGRITLIKTETVNTGDPLDGHDFILISPKHYICSSYIKTKVDNVPGFTDGSVVVYAYLQEVEDNKVIWEWKSIDHPELYDLTVTDADANADDFANENTKAPDYVHFNSMRIDSDDNLICSFRHIDTIMKINRTTGEIMWKLSGKGDEFGLTEEQKTSGQHYAVPNADGYITAFDNGNARKSTRIVAYKIDENTKELLDFKEYATADKFSRACGSAQHIKDEIFVIGWGAAMKDTQCMTVYDFAQDKALMTITLETGEPITYRCVYCECENSETL